MLRSELIRRVVEATPGLSAHDGERVVLAVLERISVALERGGSRNLDRRDEWSFCLTAARLVAEQER